MPTEPHPRQENMKPERHDQRRQIIEREAEHRSKRQEIPKI
jgi:hypothetical protein